MTSQRTVPILRLPFSEDDVAFLQSGMADILASEMLTLGKYTRMFEEAFASFAGTRYALAVSNGTAALDLIFRGLDIRDASVVVPTNTFLASALAPMHSGNRVIFADANPETLCLDTEDVRRRLCPDTKAVVLVHVAGVVSPDYYELKRLCEERDLYLIEDAAHAHGCTLDGKPAGSLGHAAGFSMFPTKVLTTGEGGVLTTNDEALFQQASMLRNQGKNPALNNAISEVGHNFRLSELTALMGVRQLEKASVIIEERQRAAQFYDDALTGVKGLRPLRLPPGVTSSYYKYVCFLEPGVARADVKRIMKEQYGVSLTGEVYAGLCHQEPLWIRHTYCGKPRDGELPVCVHGQVCLEPQVDFPKAQEVAQRHICLPVYPGLSDAELHHVAESLKRTLRAIERSESMVVRGKRSEFGEGDD